MAGAGASFVMPAEATEGTVDTELIEQGRELYLYGCSFCHGQNGEGVLEQASGNNYGPPLVGVGAAAVDFQVGTGRMPMAQPGVQAPRKQTIYTDQETRALAAYVASLGPGPAIPTEEMYDPNTIPEAEREEAIVRGGEFFRTNCTACHNFAGSGGALPEGKYAPSLVGVEPVHIYEALVTGPQQMPVFSDAVITPEQKKDIIAYLKYTDEMPSYGGFGLGSYGPVADGFAAWVVGIGGLVAFCVWIASHTARTNRKKKEEQA
ncbi:cytochrome c [Nocardioidaceae bacterium]|nr:cytochrome c [Nocardioidaceae bacterium]